MKNAKNITTYSFQLRSKQQQTFNREQKENMLSPNPINGDKQGQTLLPINKGP